MRSKLIIHLLLEFYRKDRHWNNKKHWYKKIYQRFGQVKIPSWSPYLTGHVVELNVLTGSRCMDSSHKESDSGGVSTLEIQALWVKRRKSIWNNHKWLEICFCFNLNIFIITVYHKYLIYIMLVKMISSMKNL